MKLFKVFSIIVLGIAAVDRAVAQPFSLTVHSGTASIVSAVQTGTEWDVFINAGGSPSGSFTLTTSGTNVEV